MAVSLLLVSGIVNQARGEWEIIPPVTTEALRGIWGSSGSDVFTVGDTGTILHYGGGTWSPKTSGTYKNLYGIWGGSATMCSLLVLPAPSYNLMATPGSP